VSRRIASVGIVAVVLLAVAGCGGGGGSDTSIRSGDGRSSTELHAADGSVNAFGLRTVDYQGVEFEVPGDWPVYDLATDPSTCVRFDVHAVYLGHPGADMVCPSGILGRADALLVEPVAGSTPSVDATAASSSGASAESLNGLQAQVTDDGTTTSQIVAAFPTAGVNVTLTYQDSDATVQQILHSFRAAAP
jgi:hypothetical protein